MQVKVYYHDTDAGGVVYYANYLKFLEEARTEFMAERGLSVKRLADGGTLFVVSHQDIDYKLPASYGETLTIDTRISHIGKASIDFEYEIKNQQGRLVSKARTTLVCVDTKLKPKIIPEEIRHHLT